MTEEHMMKKMEVEGLVGELVEYLCSDRDPVDEYFALTAGLEMVALAATSNVVPGTTRYMTELWTKDDMVHVPVRNQYSILIGPPKYGARAVIARADRVLVQSKGILPTFGSDPIHSQQSLLYAWEHTFHPPYHDELTLVPPSGRMKNDGRVFGSPIEQLREIAYRKGTTEIIWDTMAIDTFRDFHWKFLNKACHTDTLADHGPRLYRWMNTASILAIGMDPDEPMVSYDLLRIAYEVAVWRHDGIREVLEPSDPSGPPHLTVVQ
jgi:hypothetical protein